MMAFLVALAVGPAPAWAARDRTPPTTPTNLRITGMTPYSVSLAWNPSTDNSGSFSYIICCANVSSETVGGQLSTTVYRAGLEALRPFTLRIVAKDAAGNYSKYSNSVGFTTPRDQTPPTKPLVSVTDVGPRHVSLAWSSIEEGPVWFGVFRDGTPISQGQNWGCEVELDWAESTDNVDEPWQIEYKIFVEGNLRPQPVAALHEDHRVYGVANGPNEFRVVAVDSAGNESPAAVITLNLDGC